MNRLSFYNSTAAAEHYMGIRWPTAIWRTVLEQAITDAVDGPSAFETDTLTVDDRQRFDADIRRAAMEWIEDETNEPRRFVWVCEQLDLEPTAVRAAVERRKR